MGALVRVMVVLKRVNAGIERWGLNGCIEKDQSVHWSGSMGVWRRVRSDIRSDRGVWLLGQRLWVRQEVVLQGCKLYLAGLQALPCRAASSTLQGCKLYLQGCKLYLAGL